MCALCHHYFSPSPRIHCKTVVGSPCSIHWVPEQLGFCMDANANPCVEFGECCIRWSKEQELATELTCADCTRESLTHSTLSGVQAESGCSCGLLSFTDPSWRHFNTHNNRVLRQDASQIWNCWWKPRCMAVTDSVYSNILTPAVWRCTDQCSLSTKLQTSLWMMAVRVQVAHSEHTGFQISKTSVVFEATCTIQRTVVSAVDLVPVPFTVQLTMWQHFTNKG